MKEKEYYISVQIKIDNVITAINKEEAINIVKDNMHEEYRFNLHDDEIILVEEIT